MTSKANVTWILSLILALAACQSDITGSGGSRELDESRALRSDLSGFRVAGMDFEAVSRLSKEELMNLEKGGELKTFTCPETIVTVTRDAAPLLASSIGTPMPSDPVGSGDPIDPYPIELAAGPEWLEGFHFENPVTGGSAQTIELNALPGGISSGGEPVSPAPGSEDGLGSELQCYADEVSGLVPFVRREVLFNPCGSMMLDGQIIFVCMPF